MFRVESQIELLSRSGRYGSVPKIHYRGYVEEEPVSAPAQFKDSRPVSVGQVVGFCPTLRDLYLGKRLKVKVAGEKKANLSWPRVVGHLVERTLLHVFENHQSHDQPCGKTLDEIATVARTRLAEYIAKEKSEFDALDGKPEQVLTTPELREVLTDHIVYDLFVHQGSLNFPRTPNRGRPALDALVMNPEEMPAPHLKLGKSTPDFVLPNHRAIGDIKSGKWSDDYFLTAAGYALNYESVHRTDIDLGAIYLVETDPKLISQGRLVTFLLDDSLRNRFLDRRNEALKAVTESAAVPRRLTSTDQQKKFCDSCAFKAECFARNDFEGAP